MENKLGKNLKWKEGLKGDLGPPMENKLWKEEGGVKGGPGSPRFITTRSK